MTIKQKLSLATMIGATTIMVIVVVAAGMGSVSFEGKIAFRSNRDANNERYAMAYSNDNLKQLTSHISADTAPAWSAGIRSSAR